MRRGLLAWGLAALLCCTAISADDQEAAESEQQPFLLALPPRPPPPPLAACARHTAPSLPLPCPLPAGRALLRFRAGTTGWRRLATAAGPDGLPGWADDSPLHPCQWGGVACCSTGPASEPLGSGRGAVCALTLAYRPPAAGAGGGGAPIEPIPATSLEPLLDLPALAVL